MGLGLLWCRLFRIKIACSVSSKDKNYLYLFLKCKYIFILLNTLSKKVNIMAYQA